MTSQLSLAPLSGDELSNYGLAHVRDAAFDAVQKLWRRRQEEGVSQRELAITIDRDPATVSRNLKAPGNWTLRTFGELIQALNGNVKIVAEANEDAAFTHGNYDAYDEHAIDDNSNTIVQTIQFYQNDNLESGRWEVAF